MQFGDGESKRTDRSGMEHYASDACQRPSLKILFSRLQYFVSRAALMLFCFLLCTITWWMIACRRVASVIVFSPDELSAICRVLSRPPSATCVRVNTVSQVPSSSRMPVHDRCGTGSHRAGRLHGATAQGAAAASPEVWLPPLQSDSLRSTGC